VPLTGSTPRRPAGRDRRATWRRTSFASLDFETTGLDYRRDGIVLFGVVPVRGGRVVLREAVHQLVAPEVPVSPTSVRIHQLLPGELASAPELSRARARLAEAIADRFVVAWFADLEIAFLARTFGGTLARGAGGRVSDLVRISRGGRHARELERRVRAAV
jgi:DNA polymerase-3 subunit epsilon